MAFGFRVLYDPVEHHDSKRCLVDIVAIPRLGAKDPDDTWATKPPKRKVNWLEDPQMLRSVVPHARIMRYGYSPNILCIHKNESKVAHMRDAATVLAVELPFLRERFADRPIIFIAHGSGGLVLQEALSRLSIDPQGSRNLMNYVVGLVFFGTPFRGYSVHSLEELVEATENIADGVTAFTKRVDLATYLSRSHDLDDIVDGFLRTWSAHPIPLVCFYETMPTSLGELDENSNLIEQLLVTRSSACLHGTSTTRCIPLERNHYNLQKFEDRNDSDYKIVEDAIVELVHGAGIYLRGSPSATSSRSNSMDSSTTFYLAPERASQSSLDDTVDNLEIPPTSSSDSTESLPITINAPNRASQTTSEEVVDNRQNQPIFQEHHIRRPQGTFDPGNVKAIILCALTVEMNALIKVLDSRYERPIRLKNIFCTAGEIQGITVVMHQLHEKGNTAAARDTIALEETLPNTGIVLLAGICGGTGYDGDKTDRGGDVFLGDVIISTDLYKYGEGVTAGGILDSAKGLEGRGKPCGLIRSILTNLAQDLWRDEFECQLFRNLQIIQGNPNPGNTPANLGSRNIYEIPKAESDVLFASNCVHLHHNGCPENICNPRLSSSQACRAAQMASCEENRCRKDGSHRTRAYDRITKIHLGKYGSANLAVRSTEVRTFLMDHGIIAIDMEGDGVWSVMNDSRVSCLVIKSVSDYADSHKNSGWKSYAAATSASAVKAFLMNYFDS